MPWRSRSENYQLEITSSHGKKEITGISLLYSSPNFFFFKSKRYYKNLILLPGKYQLTFAMFHVILLIMSKPYVMYEK